MDSDFPVSKTEWKNLPVSLPKSWVRHIEDRAKQLGVSRNAAFCLSLRFGAPILDAHLDLMRETLKEVCGKIATGNFRIKDLSEILAPTGKPARRLNGRREHRK